ncbi:hypothetical protein NE237_000307 [Protea cynaroides]|uniref:Uncharacterized protein n=1 Tax=Protea cynaroides TaxID=273540 RepID=A0A9Q0KS01_9MAGN|nr:hypothetical protein NE237_000307 [Protea cynaroides]
MATRSIRVDSCLIEESILYSTSCCSKLVFGHFNVFYLPSRIAGGKASRWSHREGSHSRNILESSEGKIDWTDLDTDLYHWTKPLRPVQWYPGHIAKSEKELKEQLKLMDVVIEMESWIANKKRIVVLNREDMILTADRNAWATYFARQGAKVVCSIGKFGMETCIFSKFELERDLIFILC